MGRRNAPGHPALTCDRVSAPPPDCYHREPLRWRQLSRGLSRVSPLLCCAAAFTACKPPTWPL